MEGFERIITISKTSLINNEAMIDLQYIESTGKLSVQVNKDTTINYNDEEIKLKRTRIFNKEDIVSNMKLIALEEGVKFYITIRYKDNLEKSFA